MVRLSHTRKVYPRLCQRTGSGAAIRRRSHRTILRLDHKFEFAHVVECRRRADHSVSACRRPGRPSSHLARFQTMLGLNVPLGPVTGAETCTSSSPFNVTDALRASPSKFGAVARSAVYVTVFAASSTE